MTFKRLEEAHLDGVLRLENECFREPWSQNALSTALIRVDFYSLVCVEDDKVVGYIIGLCGIDEADILRVAVDSEYRRQGIASELLARLFTQLEKIGTKRVFLEVRESNTGARTLYESFGFKQIGIRKKYYEHTEDAIAMGKVLGE